MQENTGKQNQWKKIYLLGGIVALIVFGLVLSDIIIGTIISGDFALLPQTALERFLEFRESRFIGLYHLDMLNVLISVFMVPVFFALSAMHRENKPAASSMALIIFLVATSIFITTNTALPMLQLSGKYFSATSDNQRALYAAAGEALLVRGEHGTPGVFIGFFLLTLSNFYISFVMLNAGIFKNIVAYLGILGNFSLLLYLLFVTFLPGIKTIALMIAVPGGILMLAWYLLIAIKLINAGLKKR